MANVWPCIVPLLTTWKCVPLLWAGRKGPATYTRYFALRMHLSPALQSPFSFHLGCDYARKKKKKTILCTLCTNKSLVFMFNSYTPATVILLLTLDHPGVILARLADTIKSCFRLFVFFELGRVSLFPCQVFLEVLPKL